MCSQWLVTIIPEYWLYAGKCSKRFWWIYCFTLTASPLCGWENLGVEKSTIQSKAPFVKKTLPLTQCPVKEAEVESRWRKWIVAGDALGRQMWKEWSWSCWDSGRGRIDRGQASGAQFWRNPSHPFWVKACGYLRARGRVGDEEIPMGDSSLLLWQQMNACFGMQWSLGGAFTSYSSHLWLELCAFGTSHVE